MKVGDAPRILQEDGWYRAATRGLSRKRRVIARLTSPISRAVWPRESRSKKWKEKSAKRSSFNWQVFAKTDFPSRLLKAVLSTSNSLHNRAMERGALERADARFFAPFHCRR